MSGPTTESKLLTDKEIMEIERDLESSPFATFPMTKEQVRAFCATVRHLRAENERSAQLFKNTCRLHTEWTIDRYLMSNAINRCDPAEKAERHIELCKFYVAAVHGCSPEDAMSDYEDEFDRLHEESQELTSSLDTEIGFPLDQTPNYAELNPKFFERFHAIACRVLNASNSLEKL